MVQTRSIDSRVAVSKYDSQPHPRAPIPLLPPMASCYPTAPVSLVFDLVFAALLQRIEAVQAEVCKRLASDIRLVKENIAYAHQETTTLAGVCHYS
jgi:hypothetical protein